MGPAKRFTFLSLHLILVLNPNLVPLLHWGRNVPSPSTVRAKQRTVKWKAKAFGRNSRRGRLDIGIYVSHSGIRLFTQAFAATGRLPYPPIPQLLEAQGGGRRGLPLPINTFILIPQQLEAFRCPWLQAVGIFLHSSNSTVFLPSFQSIPLSTTVHTFSTIDKFLLLCYDYHANNT